MKPTPVADATLEGGLSDLLYHGTTKNIKGDIKYSKEGVLGEGVYLTPDTKHAGSFAEGTGGNVLPVKARANRIARILASVPVLQKIYSLCNFGLIWDIAGKLKIQIENVNKK